MVDTDEEWQIFLDNLLGDGDEKEQIIIDPDDAPGFTKAEIIKILKEHKPENFI